MKLSILDQAPISADQTAKEALEASVKLAQAAEDVGYERYWIAEHHDIPGLACPAPEVMLGYIGAQTRQIRIGSGAVLLPHYKPFKVAEVFNMLATLFPGRIDMGIGRAPGGSAEVTNALSDSFLQRVWKMPELLKELLHFINNDFPDDHDFSSVCASPLPEIKPQPWLLGTSEKSALLAADLGMAYAFGHFMSDKDAGRILQSYYDTFHSRGQSSRPQSIVTVNAYCAETTEKAEEIALSSLIWSLQKENGEANSGVPSIEEAKAYPLNESVKDTIEKMKRKMIIGNPAQVKEKLIGLQEQYKADEIMIVTTTHSLEDRIHSYKLIGQELL